VVAVRDLQVLQQTGSLVQHDRRHHWRGCGSDCCPRKLAVVSHSERRNDLTEKLGRRTQDCNCPEFMQAGAFLGRAAHLYKYRF
jgi:hypothetical protein